MNNTLQAELQKRIEAFASDITSVLQRAVADAVAGALTGAPAAKATSTAARSTKTKAKPAKAEAGRAHRSSISAGELYAMLLTNGNRNIEKIAQGLGVKTATIAPLLRTLVEQGSVRRTGQARGTKYTSVPGKAPSAKASAAAVSATPRTPAAKTATKPAAKTATKPATKTATKPAAKKATKPAAKKATKPAAKKATKPATPAEKAVEKPAERPVEKAVEKPLEPTPTA